jgi:hypothetical protein
MVLALQRRSEQANDVHARQTAIGGQLTNGFVASVCFRNELRQFRNHVAKPMDLALAGDVAHGPARVL